MTLVAVLWAVTPVVACLLPTRLLTPAERECCRKMAQQCGSSAMPASHSCCQGHQHDTAVSPVTTYSPPRPFIVARVPQTAAVLIDATSMSLRVPGLEAPPPELCPDCTSILRI